jgi:hypothetical protein
MYNLAERAVDFGEGSVAEHLCELNCCCNLNETLDLVQRLAVRGIPNSETVEAESTVFVLIRGNINVAVIVVVE